MSYFDKYLKYKNKYLALKDTVGGSTNSVINKPFTYDKIKILWDKHTHNIVDYPALAHDFSEYCWIGPPPKDNKDNSDYRAGFFLYKVKDDNYYFPDDKKQDVFRIYFIKPETDVDSIVQINSNEIVPGPLEDRFSTTIKLNKDLPIGTQYEWNHMANAWIYYINKEPTYKAEFGKKSSN